MGPSTWVSSGFMIVDTIILTGIALLVKAANFRNKMIHIGHGLSSSLPHHQRSLAGH